MRLDTIDKGKTRRHVIDRKNGLKLLTYGGVRDLDELRQTDI